jgi:hypothetical protein
MESKGSSLEHLGHSHGKRLAIIFAIVLTGLTLCLLAVSSEAHNASVPHIAAPVVGFTPSSDASCNTSTDFAPALHLLLHEPALSTPTPTPDGSDTHAWLERTNLNYYICVTGLFAPSGPGVTNSADVFLDLPHTGTHDLTTGTYWLNLTQTGSNAPQLTIFYGGGCPGCNWQVYGGDLGVGVAAATTGGEFPRWSAEFVIPVALIESASGVTDSIGFALRSIDGNSPTSTRSWPSLGFRPLFEDTWGDLFFDYPAPQIQLSIDARPDVGGPNTATSLGSVQDCVSIPTFGSATVDIVVDSIPPFLGPSGGLAGFGMNVIYDESRLQVTGRSTPLDATESLLAVDASSGIASFSNPVPDTNGNFKIVELDTSVVAEAGMGKLYSLTITDTSGTAGSSILDLTDSGVEPAGNNDSIPDIYGIDASTYAIDRLADAMVAVGQPCPGAVVSIGSAQVPAGGLVTARIFANVPSPGLGAYDIRVGYDNSLVTAVSCTSQYGDCTPSYTAQTTRLFGATPLIGITGTVEIGSVTFQAGGMTGASPLNLVVSRLQNSDGSDLTIDAIQDGLITVTPGGPEATSAPVIPGDVVTTDTEGDGATQDDKLETSVTASSAGTLTIAETSDSNPPPSGYSFLGQQVNISAPPGSVSDPLIVTFEIHSSLVPVGGIGSVQVFKNGVLVADCTGAPQAIPDPCVLSRILLGNGNGRITILTSAASAWNLGIETPPECAGMIFDKVLVGTSAADNIIGTQGPDLMLGLGGNDYLSGQNGDDCLVGGDGDDALIGGGGNDVLVGGNGPDYLTGGFGNDQLYAGEGNDIINGDGGNDHAEGEAGNDIVQGGAGEDEMLGGDGNDTMSGHAGDDTICGNDDDDLMDGWDGNDSMSGSAGNDTMYGGLGNDTLDPGTGSNIVNGGPGINGIGVGLGIDCGEGDSVDVLCAATEIQGPVPEGDSDCDGYADAQPSFVHGSEATIGTNPWSRCAVTATTNDEAGLDAWPLDFNDNQFVNGSDWLTFNSHFGAKPSSASYSTRWDLNANGVINGGDMLQLNPSFGRSCLPE